MHTNLLQRKKSELHDKDWAGFKKDESFFVKDKISKRRVENIVEIVKKFKSNDISLLDVGCGSGYLIKELKRNKIKVKYSVGLDISRNAISIAKKRFSKVYICDIDSKNLPEKNDSFDIVVCSEVLEHLYDIKSCLAELKRVVKKNGIIIISVPNLGFWKYRLKLLLGKTPEIIKDQRHLHAFTGTYLCSVVEQQNLKVLEKETPKQTFSLSLKFLFHDTLILSLKK